MWYAKARLSITVWACLVWGQGRSPQWFVYISHIRDHTVLFTTAMLEDLIAKLNLDGVHKFVMWADTGKHFRAKEFLAYWTITVPEKYNVDASLKHYAEAHGKSLCDGLFGDLAFGFHQAALVGEISDGIELKAAWENYSAEEENPNESKTFVYFVPPPKKNLIRRMITDESIGVGIARSYMWSSSLRKRGAPMFDNPARPYDATNVILRNHVLPGRFVEGTTPVLQAWYHPDKDKVPWRIAARDEQPEKEKPPLRKIQRRYESQFLHKPLEKAGRHRPLKVRQVIAKTSRLAKSLKEKAKRAHWNAVMLEKELAPFHIS